MSAHSSSWVTDSRLLFSGLIALVALLRLVELRRSRRNAERLLARGGIERGREHYAAMLLVHGSFFVVLAAELWLLRPQFIRSLALIFGLLFVASFALRWWAILSLGESWSTRVIRVAGDPLVRVGPYRFLAHPNYVGVAGEMLALPLIHGCWRSAVIYSLLDAWLLRKRIRCERKLLREGMPVR